MRAFARETRLSETTFVQTAEVPGADYRNRIWDPVEELPCAGHPSLGTAVAVALAGGQDRAALRQQTRAGVQPIDVDRRGERQWTASMLQEPPSAARSAWRSSRASRWAVRAAFARRWPGTASAWGARSS